MLRVALISAFILVGACAQQPPTKAVTAVLIGADQVALTFNRCEHTAGSMACSSIAEKDGAAYANGSASLIHCLAEKSEGRIVYVADSPVHSGFWLNLDGSFEANSQSRMIVQAVLYKERGVFVQGFHYDLPNAAWAVDRLCEKIMEDIAELRAPT